MLVEGLKGEGLTGNCNVVMNFYEVDNSNNDKLFT